MCWIGRVQGVNRGRFSLLEMGPDAVWDEKPEEYRIKEITRINFGGDYENPSTSWAVNPESLESHALKVRNATCRSSASKFT